MEHWQAADGCVAVRLHPEDEVHGSLIAVCELYGIEAAFVISGIGMLATVELGYLTGPGQYAQQHFQGSYELLNLAGNVAAYEGKLLCHLHVTLSGHDYAAFGGHLFAAKAAVTVEVLVRPLGAGAAMWRELDVTSGLPALRLGRQSAS